MDMKRPKAYSNIKHVLGRFTFMEGGINVEILAKPKKWQKPTCVFLVFTQYGALRSSTEKHVFHEISVTVPLHRIEYT